MADPSTAAAVPAETNAAETSLPTEQTAPSKSTNHTNSGRSGGGRSGGRSSGRGYRSNHNNNKPQSGGNQLIDSVSLLYILS
jgi:hypothetical protein